VDGGGLASDALLQEPVGWWRASFSGALVSLLALHLSMDPRVDLCELLEGLLLDDTAGEHEGLQSGHPRSIVIAHVFDNTTVVPFGAIVGGCSSSIGSCVGSVTVFVVE
jgi:hypothetical protein